ncbi:hypothetical protein N2152v2_006437 [Parachlorella kessleri]
MASVAEYKGRLQGLNPDDASESILQENPDRYCMFPVKYDSVWRDFKKTETTFWTAEDVDLSRDPADWHSLSEAQRATLSSCLAFLLTADSLLLENLVLRFLVDVEQPEARAFYSFQAFKQNIHSEALGGLLSVLMPEEQQQAALFRKMRANPLMQRKVEWAKCWLLSDRPFGERLVALAAVESTFSCTSFVCFFAMKRQELLPGLSFTNDMISRDEGINVEFAGTIYLELKNRLSQERLREILEEAVAVAKDFAGPEGINTEAVGLRKDDMDMYIEFVADQLATTLGHEKLFKAANPFGWLETIALQGKGSKLQSLQSKDANMSMAGVLKQVEANSYTLAFDEDF